MSAPTEAPSQAGSSPAQSTPVRAFRGGPAASAIPIGFFIGWAIVQSGLLGNTDTTGLVAGMLVGLILGMLLVRGAWTRYAETLFEGMTQRVVVTAIVAWLWAGMFSNTLQAGGFVEGLAWLASSLGAGATLLPAVTFLAAAVLATGIGTGYGTVIAFVTLFFPAGVALGADPVLMFGAILSGAVFGDNLAPVSDTTIVSAVTQQSDIGGVVASRFKYAVLAAGGAVVLYIVAGAMMSGPEISADARALFQGSEAGAANAWALLHIFSMGVVIFAAIRGRHIIEAISWGLITAILLNLLLGLASLGDHVTINVAADWWAADWLPAAAHAADSKWLIFNVTSAGDSVTGSIPEGAAGFFTMSVLILLVIAGAQVMIRGGAFQALENWLLRTVARSVRGGELTMVLATAAVNAAITINTAAEIAIAPYVGTIGRRFNINGYRRANILDANTAALGYIFPWAGGVLIGYAAMTGLVGSENLPWFTEDLVVSPVSVVPFVFQGWLLVVIFLFAAWTGFGREYLSDRNATRSDQI
jgi:Na+/H+ antiporter NhaC